MRAFFKIFFLLILFNNLFLNGQEKTFVANYNIKYTTINLDSSLKKNDSSKINKASLIINKKIKEGEEELKKINFKLIYNKDKSIFYKESRLDIDKKKVRLLSLILSLNDEVYFSNKESVLIQKNSFGENFLVKMPSIKWNITSITKKIDKYVCYKALTFNTIENSKGKHKVKVEAWFTPEIPFNFGPKNYNGLPGLIIELKENENLTFQLKNIKKIKYKKIKKPTKGKKITLKEFNELSKKMYENRGN
jgi:GLPGLI family protein